MRRLYLQIYLAFLLGLFLVVLLVSLAFLWLSPGGGRGLDDLAGLAGEILPPPDAPADEVRGRLERLARRHGISLALWTAQGELIASSGGGEPLPKPRLDWTRSRYVRTHGRGPTMALRLEDGRWLVVRHPPGARAVALLVGIVLSAAAVAIGSYPLVRRLTGRLERLQERVDALGRGQLGSRVAVEGRDEVASLASSFNRAAERIERLVEAQRTLLAGASHELRSPLARIRVAIELIGDRAPAELRERLERDIKDLDDLIGDLILASRIEAHRAIAREDRVDLLALAAEEASRFGAAVTGAPVEICGDRALVRRLLRNLLDNARRHAPESTIEVEVDQGAGDARIRVMDRGTGVAAEDGERIFEPFYTSSAESGSGLGLALVRRIAELHGGSARWSPRPGGGSVFEAVLRDSPP